MLILKFKDLENEYSVEFEESNHVVTITSEEPIPEDTSGFTLTREDMHDNWDYSNFKTIYRVINAKKIQFSDDGSVYVNPTQKLIVAAEFDDGDNVYNVRPDKIAVTVYKNGKKALVDTLTADNNWKKSHGNKPAEDVFTISAPDLPEYEKQINGTTVRYSIQIPQPREITQDDVVETIIGMYEDKEAEAINYIYASYCEKNMKNFNTEVPDKNKPYVMDVITRDHFMVNEDGTTSLIPINGAEE